MEVKLMSNNNDEIKLTTTNNTTSDGQPFPETPKPQIVTETFATYAPSDNNNNDNNNKE